MVDGLQNIYIYGPLQASATIEDKKAVVRRKQSLEKTRCAEALRSLVAIIVFVGLAITFRTTAIPGSGARAAAFRRAASFLGIFAAAGFVRVRGIFRVHVVIIILIAGSRSTRARVVARIKLEVGVERMVLNQNKE